VLLDFSRTLVPRIDALWEARKQAKYIAAVENSLEADPRLPSALSNASINRSPLGSSTNSKCSTASVSVTFRGFTPPGKKPSRIPRHPQRCQAVQDPSEGRSLRRPTSHPTRPDPAPFSGCGLLHGRLCSLGVGDRRVGSLLDSRLRSPCVALGSRDY